jgi:hypothetical protein
VWVLNAVAVTTGIKSMVIILEACSQYYLHCSAVPVVSNRKRVHQLQRHIVSNIMLIKVLTHSFSIVKEFTSHVIVVVTTRNYADTPLKCVVYKIAVHEVLKYYSLENSFFFNLLLLSSTLELRDQIKWKSH